MEKTHDNDYGVVAAVYDAAAHLYSGGQIRACKQFQIPEIRPRDRVLYAGAGTGYDAALAARRGGRVTVVELSRKMADRARRTFVDFGVVDEVELVVGDVLAHDRPDTYDVVAANFFLNVFSPELMPRVLSHLASQLRPEGKLLIADFAPARATRLERGFQQAYFGLARTTFQLLSNNAAHPLYDYAEVLRSLDLELTWSQDFPLFGVGPAWYRSMVAHRRSA
jgi:ubiquinone/menaquinone biosynthesis C-methylase UbiE